MKKLLHAFHLSILSLRVLFLQGDIVGEEVFDEAPNFCELWKQLLEILFEHLRLVCASAKVAIEGTLCVGDATHVDG